MSRIDEAEDELDRGELEELARKSERTYRAAVFGMKGILRILILVLAVVALFYLGRFFYSLGYDIFNEKAMAEAPGEERTVVIPEDAGVWAVSGILKEAGLIEERLVFVAQERLSAYHGRIAEGTYRLTTSMTPTEILEAISSKESPAEGGSA